MITTLLFCSIACLFAALIASLVQRIVSRIASTRVDVDPLDPISSSRDPL